MFYIIATIVLAVVSVIVTVAVTLQESKSSGLSASISGGAGSQSYWGRQGKGKTKEARLAKITLIAGILFIVIAILLNVGAFK